jgi:integrase
VQENIIASSPILDSKSPRQPTHDLLLVLPGHFQTLITLLAQRSASGDEKACRDLAIILLLGRLGLKASEAANLTWADVTLLREGQSETPTQGTIIVRGSGERMIPVDADAAEALARLRDLRDRLGLASEGGAALFFGYLNLTRQTKTTSLHRHGIKFVVYETCQEILGVPYNSESLRNHAIATWLGMGLSNQRVAELAGYSSLNSLERFSLETRTIRAPKRQTKRSGRE